MKRRGRKTSTAKVSLVLKLHIKSFYLIKKDLVIWVLIDYEAQGISLQ